MSTTERRSYILIVDDDPLMRESIKEYLENENYVVTTAENGAKALDFIKQMYFDIILVDYNLPDTNGLELIQQALAASKDLIPVIITGFSSLEVAVEGMRIGAHDYLVKPLNLEELKKNLNHIILERESMKSGRLKFDSIIKGLEPPKASDIEVIIHAQPDGVAQSAGPLGWILYKGKNICVAVKHFFWD